MTSLFIMSLEKGEYSSQIMIIMISNGAIPCRNYGIDTFIVKLYTFNYSDPYVLNQKLTSEALDHKLTKNSHSLGCHDTSSIALILVIG